VSIGLFSTFYDSNSPMKTHSRIVVTQSVLSKSDLPVPVVGCRVIFDQGAGSYGV